MIFYHCHDFDYSAIIHGDRDISLDTTDYSFPVSMEGYRVLDIRVAELSWHLVLLCQKRMRQCQPWNRCEHFPAGDDIRNPACGKETSSRTIVYFSQRNGSTIL